MKLNRLSLNVVGLNRIGLNRIGSPSRGSSSGTDRPYIDPEVLASLKAVCICYGKSNDDPDRAVVKNLVEPDNPFVISNAAYEGMSGYNGYPVVFGANKTWEQMPTGTFTWNIDDNKLHITKALIAGNGLLFSYVKLNGSLLNVKEIPSFKIKVSGLEGKSKLWYRYLKTEDAISETIAVLENGTHELPKSYTPSDSLHDGVWVGFTVSPISEGVKEFDCDITIEVLPEYEGAFVTDGIDDLITSTKTVQEMLGGSNEITVVSMIHQIGLGCRTNFICDKGSYWRCNEVANTGEGKTGIYGYSSTNLSVNTPNIINNVLGDKVDYSVTGDRNDLTPSQFSVVGYISSSGEISYTSSVAWYWTIIANKVLTADQINQVIAYFNLDRTLNPDILCNTIKQGITNENHAEFNDKLIDYSGNGRDIQLNNLAWKGDSGIGKYNYTYNDRIKTYNQCPANGYTTLINPTRQAVNGDLSFTISGSYKETAFVEIGEEQADGKFIFTNYRNGTFTHKMKDTTQYVWFRLHNISTDVNIGELTVEFIPSHAGALCLDGVNDFGKVTGMPIYKDYTFIIDRQIISIGDTAGVVASKSEDSTDVNKQGAFLFEYLGALDKISTWSFYKDNGKVANTDFTRGISYQSTYSYNGKDLTIGTSKDSDKLWLGIIRDNDSRFFNGAIYFLMSFPYSMSEFLIERQLKKHKLGTLYPDMVEFRPIVKSNLPYSSISYSVNPGEYISVDSMVTITVTLPNTSDKLMEVSCNAISDISISGDNGVYEITGKVVKSPQKINMIISSYLTMLSNSTLISNETLIKNE